MSMSKVRKNIEYAEGEIAFPAEGDLVSFAIITQKREGTPHVFAGFVEASDGDLALAFGREHYGQDQECVNMWAFPEDEIASTDSSYPPGNDENGNVADGTERTYQVFVRGHAGAWHESAMIVESTSGAKGAIEEAKKELGAKAEAMHSIWVVPTDVITSTNPDDLIWRHVDQSYRLARGYAKDVRDKWEHVRAKQDVDEYQKDDLKETF